MLMAVFFLGAAFGISAMGLIESLLIARRVEQLTTRMCADMFFDAMVILLTLHLIQRMQ